MPVVTYFAEQALLPGGVANRVAEQVSIEVSGDRIVAIEEGVERPRDAVSLNGLLIPGLVNAHSHAFHRALRGRTQVGEGTFFTWREQMYTAAESLDPDSYRALARGVFAEMVLAGITTVGEFHYLHHGSDGKPYNDANAMGHALREAALDAGIRLTLLDTLYLQPGLDGGELSPLQMRFSDGSVSDWFERVAKLQTLPRLGIGAAVHSVRAVSESQLREVADSIGEIPLHVHLSEQVAENDDCLAATGMTPTGLLDSVGLLTPTTTAIHATHLSVDDLEAFARTKTGACFCPTTERDLGDGIGPARELVQNGSSLSLGSDSHAIIDLFEEARAVELDERLASNVRGGLTPEQLLGAATTGGAKALGWEAGEIAVGMLADFTTVSLDSIRMAGVTPETAVAHTVFAATASDVVDVVVGGRQIVVDRQHVLIDNPARELHEAIIDLFEEAP